MILRRAYSVPEHLTLFSAGAIAAGVVYPSVVAHTGGQGLPCPFRWITGIPCPFCGLTTGTVAIAHGQWLAAAAASPLACAVTLLAIVTAPIMVARATGRRAPPQVSSARLRRVIGCAVIAFMALNWLFELHRFGILRLPDPGSAIVGTPSCVGKGVILMSYGYAGDPGVPAASASSYSDWITRVLAYLVEYVPAVLVYFLFVFVVRNSLLDIIVYLAFLGYLVWNRWILGGQGQSIGKKVMKIRLISEETGQPIGTLNAFIRDICHFVDAIICYVGFLFPLWDAKRQTIADKIMKTVVVPA